MVINLKDEYFNQRIDCDVTHCKFQNEEESKCNLGKISVSGNKDAKEDTFCDSFEAVEEE